MYIGTDRLWAGSPLLTLSATLRVTILTSLAVFLIKFTTALNICRFISTFRRFHAGSPPGILPLN
jgi:hypothetical protein